MLSGLAKNIDAKIVYINVQLSRPLTFTRAR